MSTCFMRSYMKKNGVSWDMFWEEMSPKLKKGMSAQNYGKVWEYDCRRSFSDFPPGEKHLCFSAQNLEPVFVQQNRSKAVCGD